jgi:hypothetical protein
MCKLIFLRKYAPACSGWQHEAEQRRLVPTQRARAAHDAIGHDNTWRLFINVPGKELHGSSGLGRRKTIRKGV